MPADGRAMLVRFRCSGHRNIRATHDATFELAAAGEISSRATCVIGVGAEVIEGSASGIAGPVIITIEVSGRYHQQVTAVANPWLLPSDDGFVVRRSIARLDDTLATESDTAAADLERDLVESLRDPASEIEVTVRRAPHRADHRAQLIIGRVGSLGSEHGRKAVALRAESDAADAVLADDAGARSRLRKSASTADARAAVAEGGRVLLLGVSELVGALVDDVLDDELGKQDLWTESFGMAPSLAAAAAVGGTSPVVLLPSLSSRADLDRAAGFLGIGARIATSVTPERARMLLRDSPEHVRVAGIVTEPGTASERLLRAGREGFESAVPRSSRRRIVVALGGRVTPEPNEIPLGFLDALADQGIARSRIAAALAAQPGWSRNEAYRVVGARSDRSDPPRSR